MGWLYLIAAGLTELVWAVGLKESWSHAGLRWHWVAITAVFMTASAVLLVLGFRTIPMGTAYVVFTGIGAVGTFLIGIVAYGEPAEAQRFIFAGMIFAGIVGLNLTSPT